jgi:hypothetical protein
MCSVPTADIVKLISDAVVAIAAAVTASVAIYGVRSWARELHGRARFDVARSLARATYTLRDAIQTARTPMIRGSEFPEGYRNTMGGKVDPQTEAQAYAHVFAARWEPLFAAYQAFDTQTLEAEALWGAPIRASTDELRSLVRKLRAAMEAYTSHLASGGEDFKSDRDFGKQIRSEVFATSADDKNELSKELMAAVASVEKQLLPHLRRA